MPASESTSDDHEAWLFGEDPYYWLCSRFRDEAKRTKHMEEVLNSVPITSKIANEVKSKIRDRIRKDFPDFDEFYPEVIISYSTGYRRDYDEVDGAGPGLMVVVALIDFLFDKEYPCYSDIITPGGRDWREYMLRLERSKVMVVLVTDTFCRSVNCLKEVGEAVRHGVELIPVRVRATSAMGKDITRDTQAMWPDEELENYARGKNNSKRVVADLKLLRLEARKELSRVASLPDYGTMLSEPTAIDGLVKRLGELILKAAGGASSAGSKRSAGGTEKDSVTTTSSSNSNVKSSSVASDIRLELRERIMACKEIDDFVLVYGDSVFEDCLERLESALLSGKGMDREERAKVWAQNRSNQKDDEAREAAQKLNNDRKLAKKFLMTLCDCPTVTGEDIVRGLKSNKVKRIMKVCLVLDRADAWYHLTNDQTRGKDWYAKAHTETMEGWSHLRGTDGHTINKRYLQLMAIDGLELGADPDLRLLMTPAPSPLS